MANSRHYATLPIVLALVSFMNYTDRMVLPAVAQVIKLEFGLSDTQLGLLNGFAFVALYGVSSLPLARLADRTSRSLVLAGALAFWSVATAACGLVKNFWQLAIARACVGIGESACQPVGYALVSEQFPPERRNAAMGWFLLGNNLGIVAGFAIGGWIGAQYGWRTAFISVAIPGLVLAVVLAQFRSPASAVALAGRPQPSFFATFLTLLKNRTYGYLVLLGGVFSMTIFGPVAFLPAFFVRSHSLRIDTVGTYSGLAIGLGMAVGVMVGRARRSARAGRRRAPAMALCWLDPSVGSRVRRGVDAAESLVGVWRSVPGLGHGIDRLANHRGRRAERIAGGAACNGRRLRHTRGQPHRHRTRAAADRPTERCTDAHLRPACAALCPVDRPQRLRRDRRAALEGRSTAEVSRRGGRRLIEAVDDGFAINQRPIADPGRELRHDLRVARDPVEDDLSLRQQPLDEDLPIAARSSRRWIPGRDRRRAALDEA
jgi:predicted MFS family arabinose efflux permease